MTEFHKLERAAHETVLAAVTAALGRFIADLNAEGHAFERDETIGPFAFRTALDPERVLVLEWLLSAAAQVRVVRPADLSLTGILSPAEHAYMKALAAARAREAEVGYAKLTAKQRQLVCVGDFEEELANGGFSQFFLNSPGDHAADTLRALRKIGANKSAGMLTEAMALFPGGSPAQDRDERGKQLLAVHTAHESEFEALDRRHARSGDLVPFLAGPLIG